MEKATDRPPLNKKTDKHIYPGKYETALSWEVPQLRFSRQIKTPS